MRKGREARGSFGREEKQTRSIETEGSEWNLQYIDRLFR